VLPLDLQDLNTKMVKTGQKRGMEKLTSIRGEQPSTILNDPTWVLGLARRAEGASCQPDT
jgi:hypothetical protein